MPEFTIEIHDALPKEEAALIDAGIGEANLAAAPLDEVQPLSCFEKGND